MRSVCTCSSLRRWQPRTNALRAGAGAGGRARAAADPQVPQKQRTCEHQLVAAGARVLAVTGGLWPFTMEYPAQRFERGWRHDSAGNL